MTAVMTREPLQTLNMTATQRSTRRRTVMHAFDEENEAAHPSTKRARTESHVSGAVKKAKASYDEIDDGFQFSRSRSRKTQASAPEPQKPVLEQVSEDVKPSTPAKRRRKKYSFSNSEEKAHEDVPLTRRSKRLSGDKAPQSQTPAVTITKRAKRVQEPAVNGLEKAAREAAAPVVPIMQPPQQPVVARSPKKIALPFADTPVIRRNKEMRKKAGDTQGHRRSSTGMRGRRASSLIETGQSNAVPHGDVEVRDFYKHIEQSLPEPRRMQQLLTWCGTRALPEKQLANSADGGAALAARHIEEEILKDFSNKPEIADWFSRDETALTESVKKPNPRNAQMASRLQSLELEIGRLQAERDKWESIVSASTTSTIPKPPAPVSEPPQAIPSDGERRPKLRPPPPDPATRDPAPSAVLAESIDTTLLDASQLAILAALTNTDTTAASSDTPMAATTTSAAPAAAVPLHTAATLSSQLSHLTAQLEPAIDLLADGVHKMAQYRIAADRVADRVLASAARGLERRARDIRTQVAAERSAENSGTGKAAAAAVVGGRDVRPVLDALAAVLNGE